MEKVKVLDDILEKIEGILQKLKTPESDNNFIMEIMNYAREMSSLILSPSRPTPEQFNFYKNKHNKIIEDYKKWNW